MPGCGVVWCGVVWCDVVRARKRAGAALAYLRTFTMATQASGTWGAGDGGTFLGQTATTSDRARAAVPSPLTPDRCLF